MLVRVLVLCLLIAATTDATNRCCLPRSFGVGRSYAVRFYYDASPGQTGQCKRFIFRGWIGNENNFESLEQCLNACDGVTC
ncbi:hypothetical protein ACROYT_G009838 [Oculina patagonica]